MPLANVAVDGPDAADRFGQQRVANQSEGAANQTRFRRRRLMRAMHAREGVGILPEQPPVGRVVALEVPFIAHHHQFPVVRRGHRAATHAGDLACRRDVISGRAALREVRDVELQAVGVERQVAGHVEHPAQIAGHRERRRMRRQFVGLLFFVAVRVGPEDRRLLGRIGHDRAPQRELRIAKPLADSQAGDRGMESGFDRHQVQLAVAALGIKRGAVVFLVESAEANGPAGRRVDPPFAALAGHDVRVARVDRAAAGAVVRGAEKLLEEGALFLVRPRAGLPHTEPWRRQVCLGHPQLAFPVHYQAGRIEHAVLNPGPDRRAPALAADRANGLSFGREDAHLLLSTSHAHVQPALLVGGHARRSVQSLEDRPDRAGLRIDRDHVAPVLHHVHEFVAHGADEAGLLDVDQLHDRAGVAIEHSHKTDPHRHEILRQGLLKEAAVRQGEVTGEQFRAIGHQTGVGQQLVQHVDHVVADIRCVVVGGLAQFVQVQSRIVLELLNPGLGIPVQFGEESSVDALARGEPQEKRPPVPDVEPAEARRGATDVDLAALGIHAFDAVGHAGGILPDGADRQIGRTLAFPVNVAAGFGIEPIDQLGPLDDVDDSIVHGHDLGTAHAAVGVLPLDVALQVAGQQRSAGFCAGPAEVDLFAIGGAGHGHAVIAAPIGGARAVPGRAAAVAGPAAQPQADALVRDGFPGVRARLDGLTRGAPVRSGQTVPFDLVFAFGEERARQQLAGDRAIGGKEIQRHVAVERHGETQRLETGQLLALDQPRPVHDRKARLHLHSELAAVGETDGPGLQLARLLQRGIAPARRCLEGEDTVDLNARLEDVLDGDAAQRACREVRLDRHDHPGAGLERLFVGGQELPGDSDFLHVSLAVGIHRERLLCALRFGVGDAAALEVASVDNVDHVGAVAIPPAGPVGRAFLARRIGRDGAELQAVSLKAKVAFGAWVVERRGVDPARQRVQVVAVVHDVEPHAVLVAQVFGVAAGENPTGQVPVIELAVNDHLPRRGQHLHAQVLGFGGEREPAGANGRDQQEREDILFHCILFHYL